MNTIEENNGLNGLDALLPDQTGRQVLPLSSCVPSVASQQSWSGGSQRGSEQGDSADDQTTPNPIPEQSSPIPADAPTRSLSRSLSYSGGEAAAGFSPGVGGARGGLSNEQAEDDMPEAWHDTPHPQDDIPDEVIEGFMLRDYQRMFKTYFGFKKMAELTVAQIDARARRLIKKSKTGNYVVMDLELKLQEKDRKISEMYGWLSQKESLINSLRVHCERQRDQLARSERTLAAQRQQIQSLLRHYDNPGVRFDVLADCEDAWSPEWWRRAMVYLSDLRQIASDLKKTIGQLEMDEGMRSALKAAVTIILDKARHGYITTARIATKAMRDEFGVETRTETDIETEDEDYDEGE